MRKNFIPMRSPRFQHVPLRPAATALGKDVWASYRNRFGLAICCDELRQAAGAAAVQTVGEFDPPVQLAIVCGAGGEMLHDALAAKADVFLTGEMRFHDCLAAAAREMGVLLPGHYATERFGMEELAAAIQAQFAALKVWPSSGRKGSHQLALTRNQAILLY